MENTVDAAHDYRRIARAIRFLENNAHRQPELDEVAAHLHLSASHTQRLFSRWAGISPKRFLQAVTKEHAKAHLTASQSVLDVTYETGLSSTSRLHRLLVQCEAVTPGEFKSGGEGLAIAYGMHTTPFGKCLIAATERGICGLQFVGEADSEKALRMLKAQYERATWQEEPARTRSLVGRIFTPWEVNGAQPLYLLLKGTNFQVKVWEALLRIPPAALVTYKDVADYLDKPTASRAVAGAVGSNPIHYLIPCHRVIRSTGAFGGYAGGAVRKKALHGWETAHVYGDDPAVGELRAQDIDVE